jgi:hypothetical protein
VVTTNATTPVSASSGMPDYPRLTSPVTEFKERRTFQDGPTRFVQRQRLKSKRPPEKTSDKTTAKPGSSRGRALQ